MDESCTQFKIDDVSSSHSTDREVVTATKSDELLTQDMVATSNSETVLTHTNQDTVATSNSDTVLTQTSQEMVATGNSEVLQNDNANDDTAFSPPAKDKGMPKEAVGYHIERLQDEQLQHDNILQLIPQSEHAG